MGNKVKLIAVASVVAVMASGCSGYRGSSQNVNNNVDAGVGVDNSASNGGSQVARTGQVSSQRRGTTCTPCATPAPKTTYTYTPAPKKTYTRPAPKPAGQHNQQYYLDRWKRQQAQQNNTTKTSTYNGYGTGTYNANAGAGNTTYYDYSSAGQATKTPAPAPATNTNVSASNKSIYTGSYQQKTYQPYQPTTYAGGSAATTNTTTTYAANASGGGNGSTYTVRKGDTVFEIMRQTGVYWKDIIRLNNLQAPAYNINPGQTIRLK